MQIIADQNKRFLLDGMAFLFLKRHVSGRAFPDALQPFSLPRIQSKVSSRDIQVPPLYSKDCDAKYRKILRSTS